MFKSIMNRSINHSWVTWCNFPIHHHTFQCIIYFFGRGLVFGCCWWEMSLLLWRLSWSGFRCMQQEILIENHTWNSPQSPENCWELSHFLSQVGYWYWCDQLLSNLMFIPLDTPVSIVFYMDPGSASVSQPLLLLISYAEWRSWLLIHTGSCWP